MEVTPRADAAPSMSTTISGTPNPTSTTSWLSPGAGITAGYDGGSQTLRIIIIFLCGLAIYNASELIAIVLFAFNRHRGLYFWSLLISSIGIIPYALGFLLKFLNLVSGNLRWLAVFFLTIGWYPMVTGQALVLWSRLHLIVNGERGEHILHWTKWMIIVNAIMLHIPTTVLTFGSNGHLNTDTFVRGYSVMEKIQMAGFFLQEVILSSIYIVETGKTLRTSLQPHTRKTMIQLIVINAIIITMDLALLGLEAASQYILETLVKGLIYSIKLKLEFAILGKLIRFAAGNKPKVDPRRTSVGFVTNPEDSHHTDNDMDVANFVDLDRIGTDVSHPSRASDPHSSTSRRKPSRVGNSLEYNLARFQHIEDVSTLQEDASRDTSRSRAAEGEG